MFRCAAAVGHAARLHLAYLERDGVERDGSQLQGLLRSRVRRWGFGGCDSPPLPITTVLVNTRCSASVAADEIRALWQRFASRKASGPRSLHLGTNTISRSRNLSSRRSRPRVRSRFTDLAKVQRELMLPTPFGTLLPS